MLGMEKFFADMIGEKKPTRAQAALLKKAADKIHAANKASKQPSIDPDKGAEAFHEADRQQRLDRVLRSYSKKRVAAVAKRKPVLDHIDLTPPKEKELEKKPEKQKEPQMQDMSFEYDRFERQRQAQEAAQMQREILRRQDEMMRYAYQRDPYNRIR